jgi:subtilisin family serine protease
MIGTDPEAPGVAADADLYSSGGNTPGTPPRSLQDKYSLSAQHIATQDGDDVRAINMSFGVELDSGHTLDGNNWLTQFIDWSAGRHETLYVTGGDETTAGPLRQPFDNFNGIKVAASTMEGGVFRRVASFNRLAQHPDSNRTLIDILAPGESIEVPEWGGPVPPPLASGTSFAAPHVTGTVALLQEHADNNFDLLDPQWSENAFRHEVMKAVLMNSADKIEEGTTPPPGVLPIPPGGLLGMERTVLKKDGVSTWFDSAAYGDGFGEQGAFVPLDEEMGAGHLNASRALTQFAPGEWPSDVDDVPLVAWDWGTTTGINPITQQGDINRYRFEDTLLGNSFVSITLAWDRQVEFSVDDGTMNHFDEGDSFEDYAQDEFEPQADSVINNMVLWLLPGDANTTDDAIAMSDLNEGTVQHIFFQIPEDGEYQFWVEQRDEEALTSTAITTSTSTILPNGVATSANPRAAVRMQIMMATAMEQTSSLGNVSSG